MLALNSPREEPNARHMAALGVGAETALIGALCWGMVQPSDDTKVNVKTGAEACIITQEVNGLGRRRGGVRRLSRAEWCKGRTMTPVDIWAFLRRESPL
jgi:hypothetical protein